jgi:hypothetical protein
MNKTTSKKLKKLIGYDENNQNAVQKRLYKRVKKLYNRSTPEEREQLLIKLNTL